MTTQTIDITPNAPALRRTFSAEAERTAAALLGGLPPMWWEDVHDLAAYLALATATITTAEDREALVDTLERIAKMFVVEATAPV